MKATAYLPEPGRLDRGFHLGPEATPRKGVWSSMSSFPRKAQGSVLLLVSLIVLTALFAVKDAGTSALFGLAAVLRETTRLVYAAQSSRQRNRK